MAKKGKNFVEEVKTTGEELAAVRLEIRSREERWKEETDHLYQREKALKEKMLEDLRGAGLASLKVSNGETFSISKTFDYRIINPIAYDTYARENRCVRVDSTAVKQRIRKAVEAGEKLDFLELTERETISIRSPKKEKPEAGEAEAE